MATIGLFITIALAVELTIEIALFQLLLYFATFLPYVRTDLYLAWEQH